MPSKALLQSSEHFVQLQHGLSAHGIAVKCAPSLSEVHKEAVLDVQQRRLNL